MAIAFAPSAFAQDAEERIRQLEQQLNAVTQELRSLKDEVRKANAQPQPAVQDAVAAPAPGAAETQALRKDVDQLKTQVAEVKEQATNTEKTVDQNGVRAYLGQGLVFEDPRGRWRINVSGRAQTDFRMFSPDSSSADTFTLRRARIGVDATLLNDYRVFVEEEFANQATGPAPANAPIRCPGDVSRALSHVRDAGVIAVPPVYQTPFAVAIEPVCGIARLLLIGMLPLWRFGVGVHTCTASA